MQRRPSQGSVGITIPTRFEDVVPGCELLHPGREVKAAFIPFSFTSDLVASANAWSSEQARRSGGTCCSYFFAKPDDDPEWVRSEVRRLGAIGLKSYHTYAARKPTWEGGHSRVHAGAAGARWPTRKAGSSTCTW